MSIKLGLAVEDIVSGFKGLVVQKYEHISGMDQYAVQPKIKGDKFPEAMFIDEITLKVTGKGISELTIPAEKAMFELGVEVKELASGQIGIATNRCTYLNGCITYGITVKSNDNKNPDVFFINQHRLEKVSDGILPSIENVKVKQKAQGDLPGGPNVSTSLTKAR